MKTILKIVVGIIVAVVVLIIIFVALVGQGVDEVQKQSDKHAITQAQFKQVKMGTSKEDVIKALGKPDSSDSQHVKGLKMGCIYYNIKGHLADMYQFCFTNDRLNTKSRY